MQHPQFSAAKRLLVERRLHELADQAPDLGRLSRRPNPEVAPLSFAQERLWFLEQLEPGRSVYNVPVGLRLSGRLNEGALAESLDEIVHRHEALRTTFHSRAGRPAQRIAPEASVGLPGVDLTHLAQCQREREAPRLAREEARRP